MQWGRDIEDWTWQCTLRSAQAIGGEWSGPGTVQCWWGELLRGEWVVVNGRPVGAVMVNANGGEVL